MEDYGNGYKGRRLNPYRRNSKKYEAGTDPFTAEQTINEIKALPADNMQRLKRALELQRDKHMQVADLCRAASYAYGSGDIGGEESKRRVGASAILKRITSTHGDPNLAIARKLKEHLPSDYRDLSDETLKKMLMNMSNRTGDHAQRDQARTLSQAIKDVYKRTKNTAKGLESRLADLEFKDLKNAQDAQFLIDFNHWLAGKGTDADHAKTDWGRTPIHHGDVIAYLDSFIDLRMEFMKKVINLKNSGPMNLDECYIYFKYIVRGDVNDKSSLGFLQDWEKLYGDFDLLGGGDPRARNTQFFESFWSYDWMSPELQSKVFRSGKTPGDNRGSDNGVADMGKSVQRLFKPKDHVEADKRAPTQEEIDRELENLPSANVLEQSEDERREREEEEQRTTYWNRDFDELYTDQTEETRSPESPETKSPTASGSARSISKKEEQTAHVQRDEQGRLVDITTDPDGKPVAVPLATETAEKKVRQQVTFQIEKELEETDITNLGQTPAKPTIASSKAPAATGTPLRTVTPITQKEIEERRKKFQLQGTTTAAPTTTTAAVTPATTTTTTTTTNIRTPDDSPGISSESSVTPAASGSSSKSEGGLDPMGWSSGSGEDSRFGSSSDQKSPSASSIEDSGDDLEPWERPTEEEVEYAKERRQSLNELNGVIEGAFNQAYHNSRSAEVVEKLGEARQKLIAAETKIDNLFSDAWDRIQTNSHQQAGVMVAEALEIRQQLQQELDALKDPSDASVKDLYQAALDQIDKLFVRGDMRDLQERTKAAMAVADTLSENKRLFGWASGKNEREVREANQQAFVNQFGSIEERAGASTDVDWQDFSRYLLGDFFSFPINNEKARWVSIVSPSQLQKAAPALGADDYKQMMHAVDWMRAEALDARTDDPMRTGKLAVSQLSQDVLMGISKLVILSSRLTPPPTQKAQQQINRVSQTVEKVVKASMIDIVFDEKLPNTPVKEKISRYHEVRNPTAMAYVTLTQNFQNLLDKRGIGAITSK